MIASKRSGFCFDNSLGGIFLHNIKGGEVDALARRESADQRGKDNRVNTRWGEQSSHIISRQCRTAISPDLTGLLGNPLCWLLSELMRLMLGRSVQWP